MMAVLLALLACALVYSLLSIAAALRYLSVRAPALGAPHGISILKPLSGLDLKLESNLRTFFEQDYPDFEILFAVRSANDPAAVVVEKLCREYSKVPSRLLMTGEPPYPNAKVFSLDAMLAAATHDLVVMSDSDIAGGAGSAANRSRPNFRIPGGRRHLPLSRGSRAGFWSRIEATGMNTDFMAGILVARMLEGMRFAVGPTIVARRTCCNPLAGSSG